MNELEFARIETVVEMHHDLMKATQNVVLNHGEDDPEMDMIVASAYTMSIKSIEMIYPNFIEFMIRMLQSEKNDQPE